MKYFGKTDSSSISPGKEKMLEIGKEYLEFLELAQDVIFVLSPEGFVISMSNAFENITGWQVNEWTGKPFSSLIHSRVRRQRN